jgi:hypothetical protein
MMKYRAKVEIVVEFSSDEYDNPETMIDELSSESFYTIESTDNVTVHNTDFRDIQLIK